jgi:tetratricopeptide (TPR) repeat protein
VREFWKSLDDANTYIKKNPMEWGGYHLRGWAHEMLGDNRQAIQDYSAIINLNAASDINYYRRGRCYEKLGAYQEAVESYTQIINMKQNGSPGE